MAIKAKQTITPSWFVPKSEEGQPNPSRFQVRPLTGVEKHDLEMHQDANGDWRASSRTVYSVLEHALLSWENVLDDKGEPLAFDRFNKKNSLDSLPAEVVGEIFGEVVLKSHLSGEQEKN